MGASKPTDVLVRTATPGVYRRGKTYVVRYRLRNGEERKRYVRTYEEARRLKASLTTDVARGEHRDSGRTTFEEYAKEWLTTYAGRTTGGLRESTREQHRWSVESKAIPFFKGWRLADIEPRDVRRYVASLQRQKLATATVHKHLSIVKLILTSAVEDGLLRASPAVHTRVSTPGPTKAEAIQARAMDADQLRAVLNAVDDEWRTFFELLAATGLRIGEALELRWGDVDFGAKRLRVSRQVSKDGAVSLPKTSTGVRVVPLSTAMCQRLWRLQGGADDLLFTSPRGQHVDRRWLRRYILDPATKSANVSWVTFHTFRHTCASLLFAAGKSPKQVQVWLGHTDPAFTLRVYVHLMDDGLGEADCLDAAILEVQGEPQDEPHKPRQSRQNAEASLPANMAR
jgi:integrase